MATKRFVAAVAGSAAMLLSLGAWAAEADPFIIDAHASEAAGKGSVAIEIKPKQGTHISSDAPLKITLSGKGVKLSKEKLGREDVLDSKAPGPKFEVPFTSEGKGGSVDADMVFFLCTDKLCERQAKKISIPVAAR